MIDSHVHVWNLADRAQPWTDSFPPLQRSFELDDLGDELDRSDGVIVVQTVADFQESLELLRRTLVDPRIVGVVGWVDLTADDVTAQIRALRLAPGGGALVGLRHQLQVEPDPNWLARTDVRSGLRAVGDADLVFDIVVSPAALPLVASTVAAIPDTRFVLDHAGKPPISGADGFPSDEPRLAEWAANIAALAGSPNLAVKISGLVTEADWTNWTAADLMPVIEHVLSCFGPNRVMFGSDWPVCLLAADYRQVKATLSPALESRSADVADAIWDTTARSWYRLEQR